MAWYLINEARGKLYFTCNVTHVRWVPFYDGVARPQVAVGGDDMQIWRAAINILRK
jgi:hypothetical protein